MKQAFSPLRAGLLGSLATVAVLALAGARPAVPAGAPPGIEVGTKLYRVEMVRPVAQLFPGWIETTPVEVTNVDGPWVALESSVIPRGPVWINFDQVVHYQVRGRR